MHKTFDLLHKKELIKSMLKLYVKSFFFLGDVLNMKSLLINLKYIIQFLGFSVLNFKFSCSRVKMPL